MAKGQKKSNKEARKPKAEKKKVIAAAPRPRPGSCAASRISRIEGRQVNIGVGRAA